jgi:hypothetical protein
MRLWRRIPATNGGLSVTSSWSGRRARGTTLLTRLIDPYEICGLRMRSHTACSLVYEISSTRTNLPFFPGPSHTGVV